MSRLPAGQRWQQELIALEMSNPGHSIDAIAERLDISPRTAARRVRAVLQRIPVQEADTLRRQSEARILDWMRRCNTPLDSPGLSVQDTIRTLSLPSTLERDRVQHFGLRTPSAVVGQLEQAGTR
ncbi:winged helix-turn-helix transcriptional regulator [Micromonospora sp. DT47]|uniref:winged helix-turn-helix transcriptional regulator n=1 Tax=Micromonospora sp. DT47 TaxID=3393431 RepID=UPI003CFB9FB0